MNVNDINFFNVLNSSKRLMEKVRRANAIQHSGGKILPEDWSELHILQNELASKIEVIENELKEKDSKKSFVSRYNKI